MLEISQSPHALEKGVQWGMAKESVRTQAGTDAGSKIGMKPGPKIWMKSGPKIGTGWFGLMNCVNKNLYSEIFKVKIEC